MKPRWLLFWLFSWSVSFTPIYLEERGISKTSISLGSSLATFLGVLSGPVLQRCATSEDNLSKEATLAICVVASTAIYLLGMLSDVSAMSPTAISAFFLCTRIVDAIVQSPIHFLLKDITFEHLSRSSSSSTSNSISSSISDQYGGERLYGSLGWMLFNLIVVSDNVFCLP